MRSLRHPLGSTAGASPGRSQRRAAAPPSASAAQPHRRAPRPPHARSTGDASRPPSASRAAAVAPVAEERAASARTAGSPPPQPPAALPGAGLLTASLDAIAAPVRGDLEALNANLLVRVGAKHATLAAAAQRIFGAGGKKLRPTLCFLVARATAQAAGLSDLTPQHRSLAEVTEMIHTASLVHDDVLDEAALRRGQHTVHTTFGTRVAVLVGDYLFAQSSWLLANLDSLEVIKLISKVIADFADGEIAQAGSLFDATLTLDAYLDKSYYKTASLIAASCRSEAVFSGSPEALKADMFEYGRRLGLAFQVVDDVLDYTGSEAELGKPPGQDLASGNLTAPAILALASPLPGASRLRALVECEFQDAEGGAEGGLAEALRLVSSLGGLDAARALARAEGDAARAALVRLPQGEARRGLDAMVDYVLNRIS